MQGRKAADKRVFVVTATRGSPMMAPRRRHDDAMTTTNTQGGSVGLVRQDAVLDPGLRFDAPPARVLGATPRVFLTGATGFLGAHLLVDLVGRGAEVCCLVRAGDDGAAQQRILANLDRLGLSLVGLPGRAWGLAGDLAQPGLGLADALTERLAETIDVIYHAASQVHFIKPYRELRGSNVLGLQALLRLAAARRTKPLHHLSTLALFFRRGTSESAASPQPSPSAISEQDWPDLDERDGSGYLHSKWAAEQLVRSAQERGLPAVIYRTGRLGGHSATGITGTPHDLLNLLIAASVSLKKYPDWELSINITPVDYVSKSIIEISKDVGKYGAAIHLVNSYPITFAGLMGLAREAGYPLRSVEAAEFLRAVNEAAEAPGSQRALFARLALLLKGPHHLFSPRPEYLMPNSQPWLIQQGIRCPDIDKALIAKYLAFLQRLGV